MNLDKTLVKEKLKNQKLSICQKTLSLYKKKLLTKNFNLMEKDKKVVEKYI